MTAVQASRAASRGADVGEVAPRAVAEGGAGAGTAGAVTAGHRGGQVHTKAAGYFSLGLAKGERVLEEVELG